MCDLGRIKKKNDWKMKKCVILMVLVTEILKLFFSFWYIHLARLRHNTFVATLSIAQQFSFSNGVMKAGISFHKLLSEPRRDKKQGYRKWPQAFFSLLVLKRLARMLHCWQFHQRWSVFSIDRTVMLPATHFSQQNIFFVFVVFTIVVFTLKQCSQINWHTGL